MGIKHSATHHACGNSAFGSQTLCNMLRFADACTLRVHVDEHLVIETNPARQSHMVRNTMCFREHAYCGVVRVHTNAFARSHETFAHHNTCAHLCYHHYVLQTVCMLWCAESTHECTPAQTPNIVDATTRVHTRCNHASRDDIFVQDRTRTVMNDVHLLFSPS